MFKNINFPLLIHLAMITWISLCSISMMRLESQLKDALHCEQISAETICKNENLFKPERSKIAEAPEMFAEPLKIIEAPIQPTISITKPDTIGGFANDISASTLPNTIEEEVAENNSSKIPQEIKIVPLRDPSEHSHSKEIMVTQIFSWTALLAVSNLTMVVYQVYEYYNCSQKVLKPLGIEATEDINELKRHNQALQIELHKLTSDNVILSEKLQISNNFNRILLQRHDKYKKISKALSIQRNENIKRTLFYLEQVYAMLNAQFKQKNVKLPATMLRSNGSLRTIVQMSRRIQSVRSAAILKRICAELMSPIRARYNEVYVNNVRDKMRRIQLESRGKSTTALGAPKGGGMKDTLKETATTMGVRNAKSTMVLVSSGNDNRKSQTNRRRQRSQI